MTVIKQYNTTTSAWEPIVSGVQGPTGPTGPAPTIGTGTITSGMILDGTIVDIDINASAGIAQSKIASLTTDLAAKANLVSPSFTTPVLGVATGTSFNSITGLSSTTPLVDGTAAVGIGTTTARGDHVHPTDTSRAATSGTLAQFAATTSAQLLGVISDETGTGSLVFSASPALTGTPTAPTASAGTNTTQIATMASRPWNVAWGVMSYTSSTSADTSITSEEVQLTGSSFTAVSGRLYKVTYFEPDIFPNPGSGYVRARIRLTNISGTVLSECYEQLDVSGTTNRFINLISVGTITAGTQNVVATLFVSGATGYASRDSSAKAFLVVEDIGPS